MAFDASKFKDIFITEVEDRIALLSSTLLQVEGDPGNVGFLEELMRSAHTIKGSSATMGYKEIAQLAHALEDVFHKAQEGTFALSGGTITTLLNGVDTLKRSLDVIKSGGNEISTEDTVALLRTLLDAPPQNQTPTLPITPPNTIITISNTIKVSTDHLDTLMGIFEELLMLRLKLGTMLEPAREIVRTTTDPTLKQKLFFINEFHSSFLEMSRLLAENQDTLLATRLVTLDQIFGQYPRMVRDLALRQEKKIKFNVRGGDLALDRTVIDGLGGALAHLLRNAVDHGILGEGTITLSAERQKGRAKIFVEDSGVGIDYNRVRRVAILRGVDTKEHIDAMKNSSIAELLFHQNMSTNYAVTDVSGRGVGVSAVYVFARDVGGRVEVLSPIPELGCGTRFTLDLPISLATVHVLVVEASGYTFAIPFDNIIRTHEYAKGDVSGVAHQETLYVDNELVPLIHLDRELGLAFSGYRSAAPREGNFLAVLLRAHNTTIALGIDSCTGEQDLLIKSLPLILRGIKGFSGSALLPDGRTILLIDVQGLLAHAVGDILEHAST